ncbi:MAG TPA: PQQ-binding-like beta-propeller repeat protein [Humisphaera sp.]
MRTRALMLLAVTLLAGTAGTAAAADGSAPAAAPVPGDWPCFRGPTHDDRSAETGLLRSWPAEGPPKLWQFAGLGKGFSTVSVAGGTIYTTGDVDGRMTLFAIARDGALKWKVPVDRAWDQNYAGARSTPTVDGDRLYVVSGHGLIGCYDAADGAKRWTRSMQELGGRTPNWGYAESVLVEGDLAVVTPGGAGCVAALDKRTGKTVWQSAGFDGPAHYGSCTPFTSAGGVRLIAAGTGGGLVCVDARTGAKAFADPFSAGSTANIPSPVVADGHLVWATGYGKGAVCLRLTAGGAEPAWTSKDLVCHHGGYVVHDGHVYGNHERGVACLDLKTGRRAWFDKGVGKCSVAYADGMLYLFGEADGTVALAAASPDGFKPAGRFTVAGTGPSWAHPVVAGGRLYLRYGDNLYCFDVTAPAAR